MARKSRNQLIMDAGAKHEAQKPYKVAAYARISVENEEKLERGTMENQIALVLDFIEQQNDMILYEVYRDDNITGTTFERPAFQKMMSDLRTGKVNCIVVKDLSRLGRDYIETGNLIERVFPYFKTRFIAVTDNFDSSKKDADLMVCIKNIANEMYAKDISRKLHSAYQTYMRQGKYVSGWVPYGYNKDDRDCNKLVINPETAPVVKRIFEMAVDGIGFTVLAHRLDKEGIPSPGNYLSIKNPGKYLNYKGKKWQAATISSICKNQMYLGHMIQGKNKSELYKNEKRHKVREEEWVIVPNTHEAIVSEELFEKIKIAREKNKNGLTKNHPKFVMREDNYLCGKIFCGHCGCAMALRNIRKHTMYYCMDRVKYGQETCPVMSIMKTELDDTVFQLIRVQMQVFMDNGQLLKQLNATKKIGSIKNIHEDEIRYIKREIEKLTAKRGSLYTDYADGLLTEEEYLHASKMYSNRTKELESRLEQAEAKVQKYEKDYLPNAGFDEIVQKFCRKRKLTREHVEAFVDKVVVYGRGEIEILLTYEDEMKEIVEEVEERRRLLGEP